MDFKYTLARLVDGVRYKELRTELSKVSPRFSAWKTGSTEVRGETVNSLYLNVNLKIKINYFKKFLEEVNNEVVLYSKQNKASKH